MPRMVFKGGMWRNTEDEILKAAVMKYGKNQWARIASLLNRKSAKQCKARWYEWLDPSVKKTEWSREEDELLLHTAKLMPTQWRSISQVVGRTAAQCLERYEHLLDKAQSKTTGQSNLGGADDPRKLRPGDLDPTPETKPARPDQIDLDEDELEMLAEARARLANTQGKKAKRKAREKQMEEARRLTTLQKRRELRAAGIPVRDFRRKNKYGMDYNKDIPFEKKPAIGFYDTSQEVVHPNLPNFKQLRMQDMENERQSEIEERKRKEDQERVKKRKEIDMPGHIFSQIGGLAGPERKRSKLVLPTPQVSSTELEHVVKVGASAEAARQLAEESSATGAEFTNAILSEFQLTGGSGATPGPGQTPSFPSGQLRTPRQLTEAGVDRVQQHAEELLQFEHGTAPVLRPDSSMPPPSTLPTFDKPGTGLPPMRTPNTLLREQFGTPKGGVIGSATPSAMSEASQSARSLTAPSSVSSRQQQLQQKSELRGAFAKLPTPKNEFEIDVGGEEDGNVADVDQPEDDTTMDDDTVGDGLDDPEVAAEKRMREEVEAAKPCEVAARGLPLPSTVNVTSLRPLQIDSATTELQRADHLVRTEMMRMVLHDATNPANAAATGHVTIPSEQKAVKDHWLSAHPPPSVDSDITDEDLEKAKKMLADETESLRQAMVAMHTTVTPTVHAAVWEECAAQLLWVPNDSRFTRAAAVSRNTRIESIEKRVELNRVTMAGDAKIAAKVEKRLRTLLGGYQTRYSNLAQQMNEVHSQIESSRSELGTFRLLRENEKAAARHRLEVIQEDVDRQKRYEDSLQQRYARLQDAMREARERGVVFMNDQVPIKSKDIDAESATDSKWRPAPMVVASINQTEGN